MKTKINQILFMIAILTGIVVSSCTKMNNRIKGQGPVVQQTYDLPTVSGLILSMDANIVLTHGDSQVVMIEGQQNIINNIEKHVTSQGMWNIGFDQPVSNHAGVRIYITAPQVDFLRVSGSGSIEATNHFPDSTNVFIGISGSGNISLSTDAQTIESEISGSGQIYLHGTVLDHQVNISGSGNVKAFGLVSKTAYVRISGSGNCELTISNYLNVNISGSGNVFYLGTPVIDANISGSGSIINWN